jgi:hypothetical protein
MDVREIAHAPPLVIVIVCAGLVVESVRDANTTDEGVKNGGGGAAGVGAGSEMLFDAAEGPPVPTALVAVTVNVYTTQVERPVTVIGEPVPPAEIAPGLEVAVYPVIAEPPLLAGGEKETSTCAGFFGLMDAVPMTGAAGRPIGALPDPESGTVCGLPDALLETESVPLRVPGAVGVNVTSMPQLAPPARAAEVEHVVVLEIAKSPLAAIDAMASGALPVFVRVIVCATLVLPIALAAKLSAVGESCTAGADGGGGGAAPPAAFSCVMLVVSM